MNAAFSGKKAFVFSVILLCACLLLCSCGAQENDGVTLWVLTEESTSDGMNLQAKIIAERMEEKYDGLTVQLDILPTDAIEREILLKQLRTQIMAGNGPDVYLLPTGNVLTTDFSTQAKTIRGTMRIPVEPLFSDVVQIMRDGYFLDVQSYYENDRALNTGALKKEIMDAGILDGSRFVLPLRFDIPVVLANMELLESAGLNQELLDSSAIDLTRAILSQENGAANSAGIQLPANLNLLARPVEHEGETVLITSQQIVGYMRAYQAWKAVSPGAVSCLMETWKKIVTDRYPPEQVEIFQALDPIYPHGIETIANFNHIKNYSIDNVSWVTAGLPLYTCCLSDTLHTVGMIKTEEAVGHTVPQIRMFPLRAADGALSASITYYGAVGCSCENPPLAYEFLRQFLEEEFQWDIYRPRAKKSAASLKSSKEVQCWGQVEDSWPVRAKEAVPYLWDTVKYQTSNFPSSDYREGGKVSRDIQHLELTDADLPALSWPIDEVRFPITLKEEESIEYALSLLNEEDGTPTDADIDKLAEQVYQNLRYHLAEG